MSVSKKNKLLSPEEALEAAIKEYSPYWHNSAPLLICAESGDGKPYPQPLSDELRTGNWLIFISSATGPSFARTIDLFQQFKARYEELGIRFMLIFQAVYPIFSSAANRNIFLKFYGIGKIPVFFDFEGTIARAFNCKAYPSQVLIRSGEVVSVVSGINTSDQMEFEVQKQIRTENPGVPFFRSKQHPPFSEPIHEPLRYRVGDAAQTDKFKIEFIGNWSQGDQVRQTMDPESKIRVECHSNSFYLVASTITATMDPTRIYMSMNKGGVPTVNQGRDFHPEEDGKSSTQISLPRSYELVVGLDQKLKTVIEVSFPNARVNPVAVYGIELN